MTCGCYLDPGSADCARYATFNSTGAWSDVLLYSPNQFDGTVQMQTGQLIVLTSLMATSHNYGEDAGSDGFGAEAGYGWHSVLVAGSISQ